MRKKTVFRAQHVAEIERSDRICSLRPEEEFIDFVLNYCILVGNAKKKLQERKSVWNHPSNGGRLVPQKREYLAKMESRPEGWGMVDMILR